MPTLGNALDFAKYEARNIRGHQLGTAPSTPVTGQLYYNTGDNTLYWWDGSAWVSARGGVSAVPPATTGALGTIQLAGDLAGTATSPQIAAGVITDADVNATNKDGAVGTASMRTLGVGAQQAAPGNDSRFTDARAPTAHHVNHEPGGSDAMNVNAVAGTGSLRSLGFGATQAMAGNTRLDQLFAPAGPITLNGQQIQSVADPTSPQDAATKLYVDNNIQGLDAKASVKASTTANMPLASPGTNVFDGISLIAGDRVLVKNQTASAENGIYVFNTNVTAMVRATDMDTWVEVPSAYVWVEQGATNADTGWTSTADQGGTLNTTAITWTQFSGAGQIISGAGLTKTGNTLDVGAGAGITVNADTIQVANDGITHAMIADAAIWLNSADISGVLQVANGGTNGSTPVQARGALAATGKYGATGPPSTGTTWNIPQATHLMSADEKLLVQVRDVASLAVELPDITIGSTGQVNITWGASVTLNTKTVLIVG